MTINHHPSDATLAEFAGGTLDEATTLVVALHLAACPTCRHTMQTFGRMRGAGLQALEPSAMRPDAFNQAMNRLQTVEPALAQPAQEDDGAAALLSIYPVGKWRWIGRGVYFRSIDVAAARGDSRAFMLKADPGTRLPEHRHSDSELTCVLEGAFRHQLGRFGPGDFDEADETVEHSPEIEPGPPCVCVVALRGRVEFQGLIGRLLQPFVKL